MQNPPQLSPDGDYWWDGQAWQLMPGRVAATPVAQPTAGTPPPSWLPEGAEVPIPPAPPGLPFVPQPVVVGALGGPAVYAPAWANEPPSPPEEISIGKKILLCAVVVAGAGIALLALVGVPFALSQTDTTRADDISSDVLAIIVGGLIMLPCLGVLLGFGPAVAGTFHSLGILGVLYVLGSIINASVAVTTPVRGARHFIPCIMLALLAFRAWRECWVAAIIILLSWSIPKTISLI